MMDTFFFGKILKTIGGTKYMKRVRLRPRSKTSTRSKLLRVYEDRKKNYLESMDCCEICHQQRPLDLHHKAGRYGSSDDGEGNQEHNLINTNTFMALCRSCHDTVHRHPSISREKGYLV